MQIILKHTSRRKRSIVYYGGNMASLNKITIEMQSSEGWERTTYDMKFTVYCFHLAHEASTVMWMC
jgi:hypothetical protein